MTITPVNRAEPPCKLKQKVWTGSTVLHIGRSRERGAKRQERERHKKAFNCVTSVGEYKEDTHENGVETEMGSMLTKNILLYFTICTAQFIFSPTLTMSLSALYSRILPIFITVAF